MPDTFNLLRFQCTRCALALNLVAVDRTTPAAVDIEFLCYDCLIESAITTPAEAVFHDVTGVKVARS